MPLYTGKFEISDMYILTYIKRSIYFAYIALSKKIRRYTYNDILDENYEYKLDKVTYNNRLNLIEDKLYIDDIKKLLNTKEFRLFNFKYIDNKSDSEIASLYKITRQAVNKQVNKLKRKLWYYFYRE